MSDETSGESVQENSILDEAPESALSDTRRETPRRQRPAALDLPVGARTMRNLRDRRKIIE